ncbi:hypothetical protein [Aquimarina sp. MAR_2010_214]|nr:hypothetical protein [Aquimarina sp. MAR_2010_214]
MQSFEESGYAIKSREAQRAITGGHTIFVSNCGSNHEDYDVDTDDTAIIA